MHACNKPYTEEKLTLPPISTLPCYDCNTDIRIHEVVCLQTLNSTGICYDCNTDIRIHEVVCLQTLNSTGICCDC